MENFELCNDTGKFNMVKDTLFTITNNDGYTSNTESYKCGRKIVTDVWFYDEKHDAKVKTFRHHIFINNGEYLETLNFRFKDKYYSIQLENGTRINCYLDDLKIQRITEQEFVEVFEAFIDTLNSRLH